MTKLRVHGWLTSIAFAATVTACGQQQAPQQQAAAPQPQAAAPQGQAPQQAQPVAGAVSSDAVQVISPEEVHAIVDANAGNVVIVNFWASWCPPCLEEFPDIIRVYNEKRDQGVEVLAVSMNMADEIPDIEAFLEDFQPPFDIRIASSVDDAFYEGVVTPWFGEIPITLVFDTNGELAHYHRSVVTYEELTAEVDALLAAR